MSFNKQLVEQELEEIWQRVLAKSGTPSRDKKGSLEKEVERLFLTLDLTEEVKQEAISLLKEVEFILYELIVEWEEDEYDRNITIAALHFCKEALDKALVFMVAVTDLKEKFINTPTEDLRV